MSRELVIEARTRALFNKFWAEVAQDPQWLKDVFRDHPGILTRLLAAFSSDNPAGQFSQIVSAVKQVALVQAREQATAQVDALPPAILNWVQETLEYQK